MRSRFLISTVSILFLLLALGLFYSQILRFPYYSRLSKNNSIRIIPIDGPRGTIFDRNGKVLVKSRLSFDAAIIYRELKNRPALNRVFSDILGMSGEEIEEAMEKSARKPYAPVTIKEDIDKDKAIMLEEASTEIPGLLIEVKSKRDYVYGNVGSHVFGYLSQITEEELESMREYGYRPKSMVGRDGLEKYYDSYLKGIDGGTQIQVDSRGHQTRILGMKEPVSGQDLHITIDADLQIVCDKLLGSRKGAVIVMNPKTGEILALASHPSFDPNIFVKPDTSAERVRLLRDRIGRPMFNRAISGTYPPGSVFKMVTAAAALETKKISANTAFFCQGFYKMGARKFKCWKEEGHQSQDIVKGLMNSCNVFFYNAGRLAGVDNMERFAKLFGYGRVSGIDLPDESKGVAPGRVWKKLYRKSDWYEGETLNYAIGQGYLSVTPLQVVNMTAVIANSGNLVRPYIISKIGDETIAHSKVKNIGLRDNTIKDIQKGLYEVVNSEGGTGKRSRVEGVVVAGKTGTAQNPHGRTHAWYTGFAPFKDPRLCLVVFLEHGGKGGLEPAEIAHGIFQEAKDKGYL